MKFFQKILLVIVLSVIILLPFVFSKKIMESLVSEAKQDKIPGPVRLMLEPIKDTMKNSFGPDGKMKKDAIQPLKKAINDYLDNAENNMSKKQFKDILSSFSAISGEINDSIKF
jgi:uncharacterized protein YcbK (DUF882 family)